MSSLNIAALTQATTRAPNDPSRWLALGGALREHGRVDEAAQALLRAVQLKPSSAEASYQLGITLDALNQLEGAASCLERAHQLAPKRFDALRKLAFVLVRLGKPLEAVQRYEAALRLDPRCSEVVLELAAVRRALGDVLAAVTHYRHALALDATQVDVQLELANALHQLGSFDAAIAEYQALIARAPELALAHANLGNALKDVARLSEAVACYRRALELAPDDAVLHGNLLFVLSFDPACSAAALHAEARRFCERHTAPLATARPQRRAVPRGARKLRIGYVSSDFREHVSMFYLEPLFRHHDRQAFEIYCYSNVFPPDAWTQRYRQHADIFRDIWLLDDVEASTLIERDEIDVLVDLTMHSGRARPLLFARKPAPVQVCWLAYVGTTGNAAMDYRLSDPYLDPPDSAELPYTERTWRLPQTFWCYHPLSETADVSELPALSNGYVTFGCLASFCKVTDDTLALWARLLRQVDGSRLLLHVPPGDSRGRVLAALERAGVSAHNVELLPHQRRNEYLQTYARIDVCLDTLPYNSLSNTLDAAWQGVPTLTLVGERVVGRSGLSVAENLGLASLAVRSSEQFVARGLELARDLPELARLRAGLRGRLQGSPLLDAPRFARDLEAAYRGMWTELATSAEPA